MVKYALERYCHLGGKLLNTQFKQEIKIEIMKYFIIRWMTKQPLVTL